MRITTGEVAAVRRAWVVTALACVIATFAVAVDAATTVPTDAQMPGAQDGEVLNLDASTCPQCHGGYNSAVEPNYNFHGSMMSQAGRDPLFWATLAVAEQDFDGAGDFCIRCHMPRGWIGGRSIPTDGSALTHTDANGGVQCDVCHRLTNPDGSEWQGVQNAPFIARTNGEGHYGSAQYVLGFDTTRYGPYKDAAPPHPTRASKYHRSSALCGTCHDVSNPVTGDLAHNHGAQAPITAYSGALGDAVTNKAAFRNPPYRYGVVERTYSEHVASGFDTLSMAGYASLPAELKGGSIKRAYDRARAYVASGDYADGTVRNFTCQTCHMSPVRGQASWIGGLVRNDLPLHDLTGGNYWTPAAIQWMADAGALRLGSVPAAERAQMNAGIARAKSNLSNAAALSVSGSTLRVVNLTGHKLISGYPEGRRMWLNIKWYDANNQLVREDGKYGDLAVIVKGQSHTVRTLLDLSDPNTRIYEVHGAITQQWAQQLLQMGSSAGTPVAFDRVNGAVVKTLGDVAGQSPGSYQPSLHFVLNNYVASDTRIPPWNMSRAEAKKRNALPVPATQFGNPPESGVYNYWDQVALNPPVSAVTAKIDLLYQPTSWEYIQFLYLANTGQSAFLKDEGRKLFDAWRNTGMAEPYVMASATWRR